MGRHAGPFISMTTFIGAVCILAFFAAGCSTSGHGTAGDGASYGKVGVLLSETPLQAQEISAVVSRSAQARALGYDHILLTITRVELIPSGGDERPTEIYSSEEGCVVDLIELQEDNLLLAVDQQVPAGTYEKIRVWVSGVVTEGGECDGEVIKVPSDRMDFNPRGGIRVEPGGTIYVKLMVDANKSINLHQTGQGTCIFRPVVFADVLFEYPSSCPDLYRGTITELVDTDWDFLPEEIVIERECPCLPDLVLSLSEGTLFFSGQGTPAGVAALEEGQGVVVYGAVNDQGLIDVLFVKIGDALALTGTALTDASGKEVVLSLDPDQLAQGEVSIKVPDVVGVLVQDPCGTTMSLDDIAAGSDLMVIGLMNVDLGAMIPFAILIQPGS